MATADATRQRAGAGSGNPDPDPDNDLDNPQKPNPPNPNPVNAPHPVQFALTPAQAVTGIIDFYGKEGQRIYSSATKTLKEDRYVLAYMFAYYVLLPIWILVLPQEPG
jgi:hypothetical protein